MLTIVLSGVLYQAINRELAPAEDQGVLFAFVNAPEHTNLDYLTTYTDNLTETFMKVPEKQNLFAINGFPNAHSAFMGLILKPWGERERSDLSVMGELQPKFKAVAGVNIFATAPSAIPVGAGEMPVEFVRHLSRRLYAARRSRSTQLDAEAKKSGLFIFTNADLRFHDAAGGTDRRQGPRQQAGRHHAGRRRHAGHPAGRQQRQPLHRAGPQLSR